MKGIRVPEIRHCTYIAASPARVYRTLTTGEGWDGWFTHGTRVEARPGGEIALRWKNFGAGRFSTEDGGLVLEAQPDERFAFQWSPASVPTTVAITLTPLGPGTFLELVENGYPATDEDLEVLVGCAAGWGEALTLLKFFLEHGVTYGDVPSTSLAGADST